MCWKSAFIRSWISPNRIWARIRECVDQLHACNEMLIARSEELYRTVKNKSVLLVPTTIGQVKQTTLERFYRKYPDAKLTCEMDESVTVLADCNYLSEALYNLLTNAWEANVAAGHADRPIAWRRGASGCIPCWKSATRAAASPKKSRRRFLNHFIHPKTATRAGAWGFTMCARLCGRMWASLRVESQPGKGTSFFVLLPKYVQGR